MKHWMRLGGGGALDVFPSPQTFPVMCPSYRCDSALPKFPKLFA